MSDDRPTVISTFAGCGGSSLGYKAAGFRELAAVEWDEHACECLRLNFPGVHVVQGDIAEVSGTDLMRDAGISRGDLDVLDGSPPCQGFSHIGQRGLADLRNQLYKQMIRLADEIRPRAVVMENVTGLTHGPMKYILGDILRSFVEIGYVVNARVLNATWYGVPQARKRLILIGVRDDIDVRPGHPLPTIRKAMTVRQAFEGLSPAADDDFVPLGKDTIGARYWPLMKPHESVKNTIHRLGGKTGSYFSFIKIDPHRPSPTIVKGMSLSHWASPRFLSIPEVQRLSSFPDDFRMGGSVRERWARLGNSAPPGLMEAVARHVRTLIDR